MVLRKIVCYILPIFIFFGCAVTKTGMEGTGAVDAKSILSDLRVQYALVDSISTWMKVGIQSRGQNEEIRASLYYQKPDKFRVDARGPFNEPRAIFIATEETFKMFLVAENELIRGELSDEVIKGLFNFDFRISDIRSAIFANPFLDGNVEHITMEKRSSGYLLRRPSTRPEYREEIYISHKGEMIVDRWIIFDIRGNIIQDARFSKYQEIGGILRPLKAVISRPLDQTTISIESIDPEINTELGDNTFTFPIPSGAKVYEFSELKNAPNAQ